MAKRHQAAEAAREPDPVRRAGAHLAPARGALLRRAARRAARRPRGGAGRRREGGRLLQGDGVHRADRPRGGEDRRRSGRDRAGDAGDRRLAAGRRRARARAGHGRLRAACAGAARAAGRDGWRSIPKRRRASAQRRRAAGRETISSLGRPAGAGRATAQGGRRARASTSKSTTASGELDELRALGGTARERGRAFDRGADDRRRPDAGGDLRHRAGDRAGLRRLRPARPSRATATATFSAAGWRRTRSRSPTRSQR